ncbi:hypothetical protein Zmor_012398 [Zophobas morio]|jgi:hypothetical protein|uniref:40S ribosomal protein S25 n=1 Tax=Zophobas morio TaxID=2755281 RepID=A0AA38HHV1_9CUCU|nr:hypothetical protein Zmor_012398 [Zophobas morio]
MPPKQQKSKAEKAAAALSGGKGRKKKWSKGKTKDKLNNAVLFNEQTYEKLRKEVLLLASICFKAVKLLRYPLTNLLRPLLFLSVSAFAALLLDKQLHNLKRRALFYL